MTELQLQLTRLIGKKELTFGCIIRIKFEYLFKAIEQVGDIVYCLHPIALDRNKAIQEVYVSGIDGKRNEIIGHPATLSDLHRYLCDNFDCAWLQNQYEITYQMMHIGEYGTPEVWCENKIEYNSSLDLLDQSPSSLQQIIDLIQSYQ